MNNNSAREQTERLWQRALYMLLFSIAFAISETVLYILAIVSLIYRIINGDNNHNLQSFGKSLGRYVQQLVDYLSFNTDDKPFPFNPWPNRKATPQQTPDSPKPDDGDTEQQHAGKSTPDTDTQSAA